MVIKNRLPCSASTFFTSEEWTTSLQWKNSWSQCVLYEEVPLYSHICYQYVQHVCTHTCMTVYSVHVCMYMWTTIARGSSPQVYH